MLGCAGMRAAFQAPALLVVPLVGLLGFAPIVIADEYAWDLAFLLSGAWHLYWGHFPFVDFEAPIGFLAFLPTTLAMAVFGASPASFIVGQGACALAVLALAAYISFRRTSPITAAVFVSWVSTLVILPSALGDGPFDFSHAMSYNRYGWALISMLALHLFLPPREDTKRWVPLADQVLAFVLVFSLFHIKLTYFLVALGLLVVWAVTEFPQARRARALWVLVAVFLVSIPLVPWHSGHVEWILKALGHGAARTSVEVLLTRVFANMEALALAAAYVPIVMLLAADRIQGMREAALFCVLCVSGFLLLTQNWGVKFIPLVAAAFLIQFERMRHAFRARTKTSAQEHPQAGMPADAAARAGSGRLLLAAAAMSIAYPVAMLAYDTGQVGLYLIKAYTSAAKLLVLGSDDGGQLARLAVPRDSGSVFDDIRRIDDPAELVLRERQRTPKRRDKLSQQEYIVLVRDGLAALRPVVQRADRIVALTSVNPFPFALGLEPVRQEAIWFTEEFPSPDWSRAIANATVIMAPKWASARPLAVQLPEGATLARETALWRIYRTRTLAAPAGAERGRFAVAPEKGTEPLP